MQCVVCCVCVPRETLNRTVGASIDTYLTMATKCSDPAVLTGLFCAAYGGNLADVKSLLKNNALSADVSDPVKVRRGGWVVGSLLFFLGSFFFFLRAGKRKRREGLCLPSAILALFSHVAIDDRLERCLLFWWLLVGLVRLCPMLPSFCFGEKSACKFWCQQQSALHVLVTFHLLIDRPPPESPPTSDIMQ